MHPTIPTYEPTPLRRTQALDSRPRPIAEPSWQPPAANVYYPPSDSYDTVAPMLPEPVPSSTPQLDRLLGLQAQRERLKTEYCELMQQLMQDRHLHAVYQELRANAAPKKQYGLGYGFFINAFGLTAVVDARGQLEYRELLRVRPDKFTPLSPYVGDFPGKDAAMVAIQGRIQTISKEITSAYELAAPARIKRR